LPTTPLQDELERFISNLEEIERSWESGDLKANALEARFLARWWRGDSHGAFGEYRRLDQGDLGLTGGTLTPEARDILATRDRDYIYVEAGRDVPDAGLPRPIPHFF
jgi:hypothetical protein